ncbi:MULTISPECIES: DUF4365 domain-containing protein [Streptomyces]|uniref:DUF4365 domain-containing protein n=1 Tax=Streptomyces TaxID=1883 RepID=UPI000A3B9DA6|nr:MULTISPECIES: DUF4365 domain-containing protein [Streptomyces]
MTDSTTGGIPPQPSRPKGNYGIPIVGPQPPDWAQASKGFGENGHRGDFGEQFIRMLAAAANIDAARRERDRVGVDWQLGHPGQLGTRRYPIIEAQVKCTSSPEIQQQHIAYDLKTKNYNQLAGRDYDIPRFLFLVLAPDDPFTWSDATSDRLKLRHAAYWACLHDQELCEDGTTRRVHVPRANLLTVDSLHDLFAEGRQLLRAS